MEAVVALHFLEMGKDVRPAPAWIVIVAAEQIVPLVIVRRAAANIDLGVDG